MGIDLEIRASAETRLTPEEVRGRITEAGLEPHPDYEDEYLLAGGTLRVSSQAAITEGVLAAVRLSWSASPSDWQQVIALAECIGGRIYDEASGRYIDGRNAQDVIAGWSSKGSAVRAALGQTAPTTTQDVLPTLDTRDT